MVENLPVESQTHVWRDHSHLRKLQLASLQNAPRKRRNENKHPKLPLAVGFLINTRYWVPTQIAIDMPLKNPSMKMYKHEMWETLLRVPRSCFWPVSGTSLCLSFLCWVTCVPSLAMPTLYVCRCVCICIYIYIHIYIVCVCIYMCSQVYLIIAIPATQCHFVCQMFDDTLPVWNSPRTTLNVSIYIYTYTIYITYNQAYNDI